MVTIFIAGANGFIGYPIAQALTRAGYDVYGLTRNKEVAEKLQQNEITPVIGDANDPKEWIDKVKDVDVVIDAVGGGNESTACTVLYDTFQHAAQTFRENGPPLTYIYTSGCLVHGDDPNVINSDFTPLTTEIPLLAWRIAHERRVTNTKTSFIQGVVIRPSLLYGREGSYVGEFLFKPASTGIVRWFGGPGGRVATVHQDDLADMYVKVVQKAPILGGLSFVAANAESESWDFILSELCAITGVNDVLYLVPANSFEAAFMVSQKFNPSLARDLLGWTPRKRSFGDGLAGYYASWQAYQGKVAVPGTK